MSTSTSHRNLPEENAEALEIAHGLVEQRYPSVPSYEMKLAHALLSLEEQLKTYREALEHLAYPNRAARPTGRDALDMADFARKALQ